MGTLSAKALSKQARRPFQPLRPFTSHFGWPLSGQKQKLTAFSIKTNWTSSFKFPVVIFSARPEDHFLYPSSTSFIFSARESSPPSLMVTYFAVSVTFLLAFNMPNRSFIVLILSLFETRNVRMGMAAHLW